MAREIPLTTWTGSDPPRPLGEGAVMGIPASVEEGDGGLTPREAAMVEAAKVGVTAEARVEAMKEEMGAMKEERGARKEEMGARKEESRYHHLHHYLPTGPSLPGLKRCTQRNVFTKRTVTRTRAARAALAARWWW